MNNIQMGKMIAALRKQQGLTQQQLADQLNLSNKTVSKWESGAGSPDISNLPVLADALGVSVDALLRGTFHEPEMKRDQSTSSTGASGKHASPQQKKEWAVIVFAACIGAVLGILAYNFGWLG